MTRRSLRARVAYLEALTSFLEDEARATAADEAAALVKANRMLWLTGKLNDWPFELLIRPDGVMNVVYLAGEPQNCGGLCTEHLDHKIGDLFEDGSHTLTWRGHAPNDLGVGTEVRNVAGGLKACSDFVMQRHAESVHHVAAAADAGATS